MKAIIKTFILVFVFITGLSCYANSDNGKPMLTFITAENCDTCKKVKPIVADLKKEYEKNIDFITFDISSKKTLEEAKTAAEENKIVSFFNENKNLVPFVGVLCSDGKVKKTFVGETSEEAYKKAIEDFILNVDKTCSI